MVMPVKRAAMLLFAAAAVLAGPYQAARASDIWLATATPDAGAGTNFIGKWQLLDPAATGEESEVDEIANGPRGIAVTSRAVIVDQDGNRLTCQWIAQGAVAGKVLHVDSGAGTCGDTAATSSVACQVRFIARDVSRRPVLRCP